MSRLHIATKALIAMAVLAAPACLIIHHDGSAYLSFDWSFDGQTCTVEKVDHTTIEVYDGADLVERQTATCPIASTQIQTTVTPGTYNFRLQGWTALDQLVYQASDSFTAVAGDNTYTVDLAYVGP
jgi:hypothetical protein